jgi:hypothetical protein
MIKYLPVLCLLLLGGCSSADFAGSRAGGAPEYDEDPLWDDDDNVGSGDDDDDDAPEGTEVDSVDPLPDSRDHHYRDPITVRFDGYALGAGLSLSDGEGTVVDATIHWSDDWDRDRKSVV